MVLGIPNTFKSIFWVSTLSTVSTIAIFTAIAVPKCRHLCRHFVDTTDRGVYIRISHVRYEADSFSPRGVAQVVKGLCLLAH